MNTGLAGTSLVADDLYLMAHHEVTGKPFVQPRPLGIGLAAALVADRGRPWQMNGIGETGPATAW